MSSQRETENHPSALAQVLSEADAIDRAVYIAIATTDTPVLDGPMTRLSDLANYSRLWFGVAGALAVFGGRPGRQAALRGLLAVGVASAVANLVVKNIFDRRRPHRPDHPERRAARMPDSTSFPSGHTASAFAFAFAASSSMPLLALPLVSLAAAVGYSRVHTGVHYPGDVLVGFILGSVIGTTLPYVLDHHVARSHSCRT